MTAPVEAEEAPVSLQEFGDPRTVALDIAHAPDTTVTARTAGVVTSQACVAGSTIASGSPIISVDGHPIVALATSMPLWRDLTIGDKGADVEVLQAELARLGYPLHPDGTLGSGSVEALEDLFGKAGDTSSLEGSVPAGRIVWLPMPSTPVASCDTEVSASIGVGDTIATVRGGLTRVSVQQMPADLAPGDRSLTLDAVTVPVGADGGVTDPAALAQLQGVAALLTSSAAVAAKSTSEPAASERVTGELSLTNPLTVAIVPPAAVYSISETTGCVASGGRGYAVTIVGSQLGQTYVHLVEAAVELETVDLSPGRQPSCE
ncbi:hypothetical protein GCM10009857_09530 [Agromyces soli]